jgi:hypothetical protein
VDEKELLEAEIKAYEFYAGLIERAVGGGSQARLPRWDEQRAAEYRELAAQLRRRLAELEARDAAGRDAAAGAPGQGQPGPEPANGANDPAAPADAAVAGSAPSGGSPSGAHGS